MRDERMQKTWPSPYLWNNKKGAPFPERPRAFRQIEREKVELGLEEDLQRQLQGPRVARKLCSRQVEVGILRTQYVDLRPGESDWCDIV